MAEKYRVGIIGCGSISNYHMRGWNGVDQVQAVDVDRGAPGHVAHRQQRQLVTGQDLVRQLQVELLDRHRNRSRWWPSNSS